MRIGICDDSTDLCVALASKIRNSPAGGKGDAPFIYTSAEELLADPNPLDLLFLDIELGGMDGLKAARAIRARGDATNIVFISGHPEYVFDAFDVDACGYLVKPFEDCKLNAVLEKVQKRCAAVEEKEPRLVLSWRGAHTAVRVKDIVYAEVFNRKIVLHTTTGDVEYYGRMHDLEEQAGSDFFRTHRAYLVNFRFVDSYSARSVRVGGHDVLMAKKNYSQFVARYMEYIRRNGGHM